MEKPIITPMVSSSLVVSNVQLRKLLGFGVREIDMQRILLEKNVSGLSFMLDKKNRVLRFQIYDLLKSLSYYLELFDGFVLVDASQYSQDGSRYMGLPINNLQKFSIQDCVNLVVLIQSEITSMNYNNTIITKSRTQEIINFVGLISFDLSNWLEWGPLRGVDKK